MTLEQLMAFTVTNDHARQEQVWEAVSRSYNKEPYLIRRQLTEGAVRASDRRAQFVGVEVYEAAGGVIMRDLFQHDDGGWLQDPALLDRLVTEKLQAEAETLRAEGWKWIAIATDFPYGHAAGLRRLTGETVALSEEENASSRRADRPNTRRLTNNMPAPRICPTRSTSASAKSRPPSPVSRTGRSATIRPRSPAPASSSASTARAALHIERGFVRPEDEAPVEPVEPIQGGDGEGAAGRSCRRHGPAGRHHHRRRAGRRRGGRAGGGRRHPSALGSAGDGVDRPSHPGAPGCAGE